MFWQVLWAGPRGWKPLVDQKTIPNQYQLMEADTDSSVLDAAPPPEMASDIPRASCEKDLKQTNKKRSRVDKWIEGDICLSIFPTDGRVGKTLS